MLNLDSRVKLSCDPFYLQYDAIMVFRKLVPLTLAVYQSNSFYIGFKAPPGTVPQVGIIYGRSNI